MCRTHFVAAWLDDSDVIGAGCRRCLCRQGDEMSGGYVNKRSFIEVRRVGTAGY